MIIASLSFIFLLAIFGLPLFLVVSAMSLFLFFQADIPVAAIAIDMYRLSNAPSLVAVLFFTLAGYILAESKAPERLFHLSHSIFGGLPGGSALVGLLACSVFTAFTGASGVTIIALGGILLPILKAEGFSENFSLGLVTSSGSLGLLFPPSLPLIIYGLVASVDIDQLFIAGVIPGLVVIFFLGCWAVLKDSREVRPPFSWNKVGEAIFESRYEIPLPLIILMGVYGGIFTVSETATVTLFYVLVSEFFIHRDLKWQSDFFNVFQKSMALSGGILIILCCSLGLTNYLVDAEIPIKVFHFLTNFIENKFVFLIGLNIFLLLVGCVMDIFSAIVVILPLIIPVATSFGIHPIHLAIVFLTNLEIGYLTPPVGLNLFISGSRFRKPIWEVYGATLPYFAILLVALVVLTYVPALSLIWVR